MKFKINGRIAIISFFVTVFLSVAINQDANAFVAAPFQRHLLPDEDNTEYLASPDDEPDVGFSASTMASSTDITPQSSEKVPASDSVVSSESTVPSSETSELSSWSEAEGTSTSTSEVEGTSTSLEDDNFEETTESSTGTTETETSGTTDPSTSEPSGSTTVEPSTGDEGSSSMVETSEHTEESTIASGTGSTSSSIENSTTVRSVIQQQASSKK